MVEFVNRPSTSSTPTSAYNYTYTDTYTAHSIRPDQSQSTLQAPDKDYRLDAFPSNEDEPPVPPSKDFVHLNQLSRLGSPSTSTDSAYDETLRGLEKMDIRELLAQCEDPAIGWASQFWATIADPVVSHLSIYLSLFVAMIGDRSIPMLFL